MTSLIGQMLMQALELTGTHEDGVAYHRKIIEALRFGDPQRAEDTMRGHLVTSMRNYEVAGQATAGQSDKE